MTKAYHPERQTVNGTLLEKVLLGHTGLDHSLVGAREAYGTCQGREGLVGQEE